MLKTIAVLSILVTFSAHARSSFREISDVLYATAPVATNQKAAEEILLYQRGGLPHYEFSASQFFVAGVDRLAQAAKRTITDKHDYFPRIEKLLHPNGICFTGRWQAVENSPFTGYFTGGKQGLVLVRVSTAMTNTVRGDKRGFGIVGKLYPTMNPDETVDPAHFFTVDVLTGTDRASFLGTATTNNPAIGFFGPDFLDTVTKLFKALTSADKDLLYRPVYEVSEAGMRDRTFAHGPTYIKIDTFGTPNNALDFRHELNIPYYQPNGLVFTVSGSDHTKDPRAAGWTKLADMYLDRSTVSYACDRQIHFAHPKSR